MIKPLLLCALVLAAAPAAADVTASSANGFAIESKATVPAKPADAYAALVRIGNWWIASHTYSGKAASLSLDAKAGGCFCETWGGGAVEHGRVIYARPGRELRLSAALGPLQSEAVVGTLTWTLKPVQSGTEITQRYVVGGYIAVGADKFAGPVDQVMTQQLASFAKSLTE